MAKVKWEHLKFASAESIKIDYSGVTFRLATGTYQRKQTSLATCMELFDGEAVYTRTIDQDQLTVPMQESQRTN